MDTTECLTSTHGLCSQDDSSISLFSCDKSLSGGGGLVTKLYLTLLTPLDCSPPGSSVHMISQARILEWVAFPFFRGSSSPRDQTSVPCNTGDSGDTGSNPGSGRSPEEGNATHSSILAWEIMWTEEPGGLQSMGSQKRWT